MPSNKETLFQEHIAVYLKDKHNYEVLQNVDQLDTDYHIIVNHLIDFVKNTQPEKYKSLQVNFGTDADIEIIKALKQELTKTPMWILMRSGLNVRGTKIIL